ncbi:MAG TPA: MBL fold metallo-hydrolase [Caulobacteraceae bacterium]|jgi:glyoxylase-like metal-dependent hydrolase (beta-lactamase superfamily II)|nr:MBL fold metallo-hydrolase [Caulobacteraceae bacterium]
MIPFVRDITFEYGVADQVSPLIRRVVANNPGPFTFTGTGAYIVGQGEVAVIDPGPDMADHLVALLKAVEGERVTHIVTTHTHSDHSPLSMALARETGATIYGRPDPALGPAAVRVEEGGDANFRPDVAVADGQLLRGPGWTLEAIATPGHISNHVCYALAEENALFSGDHVMGWSTTVISPPHGDMTDYYASLDKVAARGFTTLWPTHGPPITEVATFLAEYKAHRLDRERQILEQLGKGHGRIAEMIPEMYAAVDPRLHPAAANSVLAHMIHLVRQGVIATDEPPGPASAYRLAG